MRMPMSKVWGAVLILAGGWMGAGQATACDRPYSPPVYQTVTVWEQRVEAYSTWVTRYDHCGRAYRAEVIRYRTVSVPVIRRVRVS